MKNLEVPQLLLVSVLAPLLILSILSVVLFTGYASDALVLRSSGKIEETQSHFSFLFQELKRLSNYIGNHAETVNVLRSILAGRRQMSLESFQSYNFIKHILATSLASDDKRIPIKQSIYLYFPNENQRFFSSDRGLVHPDEYYDVSWLPSTEHLSKPFFSSERVLIQPYAYADETAIIRFSSLLPYTGREAGSGLIVLNVNQEYFEQNLNPSIVVYSNGRCIINAQWDTEAVRVFISQDAMKGRIRIGGKSFLAFKSVDPTYNLVYVNLEDARLLYQFPLIIIALTVVLCLLLISISGLVLFRVNQRQERNVHHLLALFDRARMGNIPSPSRKLPEGSYEALVNNIVNNFIENEYLRIQLSERIYKARMLELLALQNQINPHFLFNTLDAINWRILATYGSDNLAVSMMQDLATLLKYSFTGQKQVRLKDELESIQIYMHLQTIRSRSSIVFNQTIAPESIDAVIPKMIIQPIAENSIFHSKKSVDIQLEILKVLQDEATLISMSIIDNGPGIKAEILKNLQEKVSVASQRDDDVSSDHIGLVNTFRRIVLFFGEQNCSCKLESIPYERTAVTFTFPYITTIPETSFSWMSP